MPESTRGELIAAIKDERARTKRVLDNFPASASEMRPHATSPTARELTHVFSLEAGIGTMAVKGTLDLSKMGSMRKLDLLRFMLNDHIHHRGQLSVYLRMSGGKVPSIYGPSKDEPWR